MAGIDHCSGSYLFRVIIKSKHGEKLRASGWIVYGTLRELFKRKLVDLGHTSDRFSFDSCRPEGAMAPANSAAPGLPL